MVWGSKQVDALKISGRLVLLAFAGILLGVLGGCSLRPRSLLPNAIAPQLTPTYDGSGQVTEPSIRFFPGSWNSFKYWLVVNPFPENDSSKENPSILVSNDGASWQVPPGLTNPIALATVGHLADGELFYDPPSDQLWVYYIWEDEGGKTHLMRKTSSYGVDWSAAEDLLQVHNYNFVSPSFTWFGGRYWAWSVNAGSSGCNASTTVVEYRTSSDGAHWSIPLGAVLSQPGYTIWHIEVFDVPALSELWMLMAAYHNGDTCGGTTLFFAKSSDGVRWSTYQRSILDAGTTWDNGQIYRSTGTFDSELNTLRVWYSARQGSVWHIGYTQGNYSSLLRNLSQ